jgi:hypothetical protein
VVMDENERMVEAVANLDEEVFEAERLDKLDLDAEHVIVLSSNSDLNQRFIDDLRARPPSSIAFNFDDMEDFLEELGDLAPNKETLNAWGHPTGVIFNDSCPLLGTLEFNAVAGINARITSGLIAACSRILTLELQFGDNIRRALTNIDQALGQHQTLKHVTIKEIPNSMFRGLFDAIATIPSLSTCCLEGTFGSRATPLINMMEDEVSELCRILMGRPLDKLTLRLFGFRKTQAVATVCDAIVKTSIREFSANDLSMPYDSFYCLGYALGRSSIAFIDMSMTEDALLYGISHGLTVASSTKSVSITGTMSTDKATNFLSDLSKKSWSWKVNKVAIRLTGD